MIRARVAPILAGPLLISGARVALANDLFVRRNRGRMLLRLDDLQPDPKRPSLTEQAIQDLRWFGIEWHDTVCQSDRLAVYQDAIERLKRDRFIYPCFETEEELKAKLEFRRKRNQPQIYDRAMLSLTDKQRHDAEAGGKRPHWRLRLSGRTLDWQDLILGQRQANLSAVSDPILVHADGSPAPLLASVIDDIDHGITHIIRPEDNAGNTAVQIELCEILRGSPASIRFAHLPTLVDSGPPAPDGRKAGSLTLRHLRNDGVEPDAIAAALLGTPLLGGPDSRSREELAQRFALGDVAAAGFDITRLLKLNRRVLEALDFAAVVGRLPGGATEAFWLAVRGSLDLLKEARGWWDVVAGTIVPPVIEGERALLLAAGEALPYEPWDDTVWTRWMHALEQATGRTGEALLTPLRLALTGEDSGPELARLLPLIGRPRAASRLAVAAA